MKNSIFITATDTDAGKTFISAILLKKLLDNNKNCAYIKPFETGLGASFRSIDYNFIKKVNPLLNIEENQSVLDKYYYPLSPYDTAKKENRKPDTDNILKLTKDTINSYDYSVVEGAGGVYVPITAEINIVDFIFQLNIPCVVVGRAGLGTINHSVLTIKALLQKGIKVNAFILNGKGDFCTAKSNANNITRLTGVKCAGIVKHINNANKSDIEKINLDWDLIFNQ